jgi:hypothetical protein
MGLKSTRDDLDNRIKYHRPSEDAIVLIQVIRKQAYDLSHDILEMVSLDREREFALKKVEEALAWAIGGIARDPKNWAEDS